MIRIALAGQPNSGKSTVFNQVAGYRSITSNFPGKTVTYFISKVSVEGEVVEVVDLPGTYSLTSSDEAELEARNYILRGKADVIINVVDATVLSRSLEFTLQLMQLGKPIVICLNMMDEAEHKGLRIQVDKLSEKLGIPIIPTVASRGIGVSKVFSTALKVAKNPSVSKPLLPFFSSDVEEAISSFMLDTFMHRMGLHGKAVFPMLLGYGCSVPAIMATRIMESRRDRAITSSLVLLIPCSGRTIVILGLVGYYMGMNAAFSIYLLDLLVIAIVGFIISHLKPEVTPGMILEIPELRWSVPKIMLLKIWLRLKEFLIVAWPLLIISSVVLSLMDFYGFNDVFDTVMAPLTSTLLGLPTSAGTPLILSILGRN